MADSIVANTCGHSECNSECDNSEVNVLPMELLDMEKRQKNHHDANVPNILQQNGELIKSSQTRRPKKSVKKKIQDGAIDIAEFEVDFDKFPYINKSRDITLEELKYITRQLGFIPINFVEVVYAHPKPLVENGCTAAILKLYPLNHEIHGGKSIISPFPNMFWCFCPELHAKVSILEEDGYVQAFTERLQKSERSAEYLSLMRSAHQRYAEERWDMLTEIDQEYVKQHGWIGRIKDIGIAGIKNFDAIKCLHCHYAHFLARPEHNNIIGRWVHELLIEKGLINP